MLIFIRKGGTKFPVEVSPRMTVFDLKRQLEAQLKSSAHGTKLIFGGRILDNEKTLAMQNIQKEAMLMAIPGRAKPWKCRLCTSMNDKDAMVCSMCTHSRYSSIQKRDDDRGG